MRQTCSKYALLWQSIRRLPKIPAQNMIATGRRFPPHRVRCLKAIRQIDVLTRCLCIRAVRDSRFVARRRRLDVEDVVAVEVELGVEVERPACLTSAGPRWFRSGAASGAHADPVRLEPPCTL